MDREAKKQAALKRLEQAKANVQQRLQERKRAVDAKKVANSTPGGASSGNGSSNPAPGQTAANVPQTQRDAANKQKAPQKSSLFKKPYIEYDFSTMENSYGGYMTEPKPDGDKSQNIDNLNWLESLSNQQPPFAFDDPRAPECFECGTKEIDFRLWRVFNARVCKDCRRKLPEKYSLLTKTECRQDYLLTESELRDTEILPHLERPNPYQQTYSNMMLYLRYQVEEFAFKKWGGEEKLDEEYERREQLKKDRKQKKFEQRLKDIRNKTRAQAVTKMGTQRHVHIWSQGEPQEDGTVVKMCGGCGMKRTELQL